MRDHRSPQRTHGCVADHAAGVDRGDGGRHLRHKDHSEGCDGGGVAVVWIRKALTHAAPEKMNIRPALSSPAHGSVSTHDSTILRMTLKSALPVTMPMPNREP